jgi:hypothetical protein
MFSGGVVSPRTADDEKKQVQFAVNYVMISRCTLIDVK